MSEEQKLRCLALAEHAIGMDNHDIYMTHGAKVYVPYRNYFSCGEPEKLWELMVRKGYAEREDRKDSVIYSVTPNGIQWMVHEMRIYICLTY